MHCTYRPAESPSSTALKQKPGSALTCANWTVKSKNSWLLSPRAGFGWWGILSSMEGCPICHSSVIGLSLGLQSRAHPGLHPLLWLSHQICCLIHLPSPQKYVLLLYWRPVWAPKQSPRQNTGCSELSCKHITWNICTSFRSSPWCASNQQNRLSGIGPSVWLTCLPRLGDTRPLVVCLLRKVSSFSFLKLL